MQKRESDPPTGKAKLPPPRRARDDGRFGQALALGTNMAAGMAVLAGLGYWIDRKRGGGIGWTLGGMFLGLIYGLYELWKAARAINQGAGSKDGSP